MAARPNRLRAVLRHAQHKEERALQDAAASNRRTHDAGEAAEHTKRALEELDADTPTTGEGLMRHRQRAELRAHKATLADVELREMLEEQLEAREQLRGAVRRRRSLEELEARRIATQAGMAAHAAQRALDELAMLRRRSEEEQR